MAIDKKTSLIEINLQAEIVRHPRHSDTPKELPGENCELLWKEWRVRQRLCLCLSTELRLFGWLALHQVQPSWVGMNFKLKPISHRIHF